MGLVNAPFRVRARLASASRGLTPRDAFDKMRDRVNESSSVRSRPRAVSARARSRPTGRAPHCKEDAQVERLARVFRALGDPTRSKLVYALSAEELCVTELAGILGTSLSATSHQLRILRDLEMVRVRRQGKNQFYALNERTFGFCSPRSCQAWKQVRSAGR
jgi:DNA-binding transcriptional ArsR family regulator